MRGFGATGRGHTSTMSTPQEDQSATGISDDQLSDELVPGEDNPLAAGHEDGETVDDLLTDGKPAEVSETDRDQGRDRDETRNPDEGD